MLPGIDVANQVGVHLTSMGKAREQAFWIDLSEGSWKEGGDSDAQFKFRHHDHQHVEGVAPLEARLKADHSAFFGCCGAVPTEHRTDVMAKHRRWRALCCRYAYLGAQGRCGQASPDGLRDGVSGWICMVVEALTCPSSHEKTLGQGPRAWQKP